DRLRRLQAVRDRPRRRRRGTGRLPGVQDDRHGPAERGAGLCRGRGRDPGRSRPVDLFLSEDPMMVDLNSEQVAIRDGVDAVCKRFGDEYWAACDRDEKFPTEFHRAMATDGWLGVTMPEEYGGAGLGVTEAAIVMHTVATHGA